MIKVTLVSSKSCTINGVGLLEADQPVELDDRQLRTFERVHGVKIGDASFPPHVQLMVEVN